MIPRQLRDVDRRLLMAGAGSVGVLLGLVFVVSVFGRDGGEAASPPAPRAVAPTGAEVELPEKPARVEAVASVLPGRDPFRQLVTVPKALTSSPAAPSGQTPLPAPVPTQAPTVAAPSSTTPPGKVSTHATLELKSIVKDGSGVARANVIVDGQPFSPAQGEVFSYGYRLERIDGNCVDVSAQAARARMCVPGAKP